MATASLVSSERGSGGKSAGGRDRRVDERFDLSCAPGTLIHKGASLACEMLDVSLSGCRLRTFKPFTEGALESVKVVLSIQEMVLSIWGITQWTTWDGTMGIRFIHPTGRSRNQLAELLMCLLDKAAVEVVKKAIAAAADQVGSAILALEHRPVAEPEVAEGAEGEESQAAAALPAAKRPELRSEYKVLSMEAGESPAVLHLVADERALEGHVVDVSQDGCLVRLARPFQVRLKAQAEVDFHLRGLPFRLPGTTKEMHGERIVEVRFTEMSRRKREDLALVILELIERN